MQISAKTLKVHQVNIDSITTKELFEEIKRRNEGIFLPFPTSSICRDKKYYVDVMRKNRKSFYLVDTRLPYSVEFKIRSHVKDFVNLAFYHIIPDDILKHLGLKPLSSKQPDFGYQIFGLVAFLGCRGNREMIGQIIPGLPGDVNLDMNNILPPEARISFEFLDTNEVEKAIRDGENLFQNLIQTNIFEKIMDSYISMYNINQNNLDETTLRGLVNSTKKSVMQLVLDDDLDELIRSFSPYIKRIKCLRTFYRCTKREIPQFLALADENPLFSEIVKIYPDMKNFFVLLNSMSRGTR